MSEDLRQEKSLLTILIPSHLAYWTVKKAKSKEKVPESFGKSLFHKPALSYLPYLFCLTSCWTQMTYVQISIPLTSQAD